MKSMQSRGLGLVGVAVLAGLLGTGCATNIRKPAMSPAPTEVKLSTFKQCVMTPVTIAPAFSASSANQKACKKIETELFTQLSMALPGLEKAETDDAAAPKGKRVLVIEPVIEEIKFIGGFARFMVGGMAGSSAAGRSCRLRSFALPPTVPALRSAVRLPETALSFLREKCCEREIFPARPCAISPERPNGWCHSPFSTFEKPNGRGLPCSSTGALPAPDFPFTKLSIFIPHAYDPIF